MSGGGDRFNFENQPDTSASANATSIQGVPVPAPSGTDSYLHYNGAVLDWKPIPAAAEQIYTCPSGAAVLQLVYKTGVANAVDLADASNPAKMRAIGVIVSKPTATSCIIEAAGEVDGFTGRTPNALQYADPASPGGITETRPDPLVNEVQEVGYAKSTTVIVFTIIGNPPIPV